MKKNRGKFGLWKWDRNVRGWIVTLIFYRDHFYQMIGYFLGGEGIFEGKMWFHPL